MKRTTKMGGAADFAQADLLPATTDFKCPNCGHQSADGVDLAEDDFGVYSVPDSERFIECPGCSALLDIGWRGWIWLDGGCR